MTRLKAAAEACGWRAVVHGASPGGFLVAALYDPKGEYVGIVSVGPNDLVPRGDWEYRDRKRLLDVVRAYARSAEPDR